MERIAEAEGPDWPAVDTASKPVARPAPEGHGTCQNLMSHVSFDLATTLGLKLTLYADALRASLARKRRSG